MEEDLDYDRPCHCGKCRSCLANLVSDYDSDTPCYRCGGAGCTRCEE